MKTHIIYLIFNIKYNKLSNSILIINYKKCKFSIISNTNNKLENKN